MQRPYELFIVQEYNNICFFIELGNYAKRKNNPSKAYDQMKELE
jgi:hypothetical protein